MSVTIEQQREDALVQIRECLAQHGKCAFIRPTGWGKTWISAAIADEYERVLYLYPTETIRNSFLYAYYILKLEEPKPFIPHVTFMSYSKLRLLDEDELKKFNNFDLIISDECDILGAAETMRAMFDLLSYASNAHLLGVTATPERQDMVDEIALFFDDHTVTDYTLRDALDDGIIKRPYYVTCCYDDTAKELLDRLKRKHALEVDRAAHKKDKKELGAYFYAKQLECSNFLRMDKIISEELEKANLDTNYQKYIVFFSCIDTLYQQKIAVKNWFAEAFPEHRIKELIISSENKQTRSNVDKLGTLVPEDNKIDLIYTINMLNMGYHVDTLTGIIMMRGTSSSHIFVQQLGRVLSTGTIVPGIVFDVMDNLHRPANYKMYSEQVKEGSVTEDGEVITAAELAEYEELVERTSDKDENNRPIKLTTEEKDRLIYLKKKISKISPKAKVRRPGFGPEDFIVSQRGATTREIVAKTVAELISMRCRQAWSRWLAKGGDASIMTKEFILSQKAPDATPLPPFCRLKHVSVEAVLDEMGVL